MVAVGRLEPGSRLPTVASSQPHSTWPPAPSPRLPRTRSRRHRHDPRPGGTFVADEPPHSNHFANARARCRHRRWVRVHPRPARARSRRDAQRPRRCPRPRRRTTRDLNTAGAAKRRSARLRKAGTAPYPGGRSLCCSDSRAATTVTSVSSTGRTPPTLTCPVDGRRCLGSVDRTVGEFTGLGRRHHPFPDRFDRTLLPAVTDIELPAGDLKDPTCHIAGIAPQPAHERRDILRALRIPALRRLAS